jgi:serine/threonine-protein kinase
MTGSMAEVPGKFGRYEILERVGRGGMGVLYRGKDPVLDREVAIKVMSGDFTADETARSRFFREARAAARLQHRNIVTIYEFAEDEHGTPYIAMEFLRGQSLAARLPAQPPLTLVQKLDILVQLCTGLHYAHEQGIVHRDVKPANSTWRPSRSPAVRSTAAPTCSRRASCSTRCWRGASPSRPTVRPPS